MTVAAARQAGFTLVEVVVSIALFAMLMGLVYGAFGISVRAHDLGQDSTDRGSVMRVTSEFLRNSIAAATPVAVAVDGKWSVIFEGGEGRLRYATDLPGHVGAGGVHEILLRSQRDDGDWLITMQRRALAFDEDGELTGDFQSRELLRSAQPLQVRFFGDPEGKDDGDARWHDEWEGSRRMPMLVELSVAPADGAAWPLLRVSPRGSSVRYLGSRGRSGAPGADPTEGSAGDAQPVPPAEAQPPPSTPNPVTR